MFGKKKRSVMIDGKLIELEPARKGIGSLFAKKAKMNLPGPAPGYAAPDSAGPASPAGATDVRSGIGGKAARGRKDNRIKRYIEGTVAKHKGLESALRDQGIKESAYEFVKRMIIASIMFAVVITAVTLILFAKLGLSTIAASVIAVLIGVAVFNTALGTFLNFPTHRSRAVGKNIERDILFAARDMIISLRSGMPLFNAITSISTGYGDTSKEFARIVERVQLGTPLEDAIDQTVAETKSSSFKRIMLQASVSIRAGADVVDALQGVIDQLDQERVIDLRRYGQKLNALAMFYMLFGIILPSMGVAIVTILTTFISLFTVTPAVLEFVIVGLLFMQIVFLQIIRNSRPVFSM
jgi:pilus assembly protein TadC